jgi:hypothetical protein
MKGGTGVVSDNLRRLRAIRKALNKAYPFAPRGNLARHLNVLAELISGIVGSRRSNLPEIADKIPDKNAKAQSRVKRMSRWLNNERITAEIYFLPFAEELLRNLALQTLLLVMDGSTVGRGCVSLMVSLIYQRRALPIAWIVVRGTKGHFPQQAHIALIKEVEKLLPDGIEVVFAGDGEFDGINLQETLHQWGWHYVCRTAKTIKFFLDGQDYSCMNLGALVKPGKHIVAPEILFTAEKYGPVQLICWWAEGYKDPLYLVTNMASAEQAYQFYRKRFYIETFFSDQKSRGFNLHKSHISDPQRLARLMMATCLAYIWLIYLGILCLEKGWHKIVHRTDRCDLSLFQLGRKLLDHFLNWNLDIPVEFHISLPEENLKSVR